MKIEKTERLVIRDCDAFDQAVTLVWAGGQVYWHFTDLDDPEMEGPFMVREDAIRDAAAFMNTSVDEPLAGG